MEIPKIVAAGNPGNGTTIPIPESSGNPFKLPLPPTKTPLAKPKPSSSPGYAIKKSLQGHNSCVSAVKFSPDGGQLVSGSADKLLMMWDVEAGRCLQTLAGHGKGINDVAWSAAGLLASCSDDKTVRLWDPRSGLCVKTLISTLASSEIMYALDASFTGRTRIKTCGPVSTLLLSAALVAQEAPSVVPVVWYLYSDSVSEYSEKLSSSDS